MKETQHKYSAVKKWATLCTILICGVSCNDLHADETDDTFRFELTPYLWAATISGTFATGGDESPPIDSDYSFFSMENIDGVASATFTAHKNQWGFLSDFLYVAYEDTFLESTPLQVTPRLEGRIVEFAGTYAPASINNLEFIAGLRHQNITISLASRNSKPEQTAAWTDPFAGVIYSIPFRDNFYTSLRGDLGGLESDIAINAEVLLGYQMNNTLSLKLAYRYLKIKFNDNDFIYDLSLDGFLFGLGIRF